MSNPTITHVIKLTVTGVEIELSKVEAEEVHKALGDLLGDAQAQQESNFEKIKRELEKMRDRMPRDRFIPSPYPVPYPV
jgi:formiminotetrahydrofolate cyclodeaminase